MASRERAMAKVRQQGEGSGDGEQVVKGEVATMSDGG